MKFARTTEVNILRSINGNLEKQRDVLAIEEPVEMYVATTGEPIPPEPFAITMRTPGHDGLLIAGLLFSEGIVSCYDEIQSIDEYMTTSGYGSGVHVWLQKGITYDLKLIHRNVLTNSSCGFCGRVSMPLTSSPLRIPSEDILQQAEVLYTLPETLRKHQVLFKHTGGIHAAALFDRKGLLINLFEDVGRHNAMDKLVGHALINNQLPFTDRILCYSGRVSFELMQKAVMAQVPVVIAIGAPSSLAVEVAQQYNITLIGFVKTNRFNVYNHAVTTVND